MRESVCRSHSRLVGTATVMSHMGLMPPNVEALSTSAGRVVGRDALDVPASALVYLRTSGLAHDGAVHVLALLLSVVLLELPQVLVPLGGVRVANAGPVDDQEFSATIITARIHFIANLYPIGRGSPVGGRISTQRLRCRRPQRCAATAPAATATAATPNTPR